MENIIEMSVGDWITLAGVIQFCIGVIIAGTTTIFSQKLPHKLLWKFTPSKPAVICLATSTKIKTEKYIKPATGLGQVQALVHILPSIIGGYGQKHNTKIGPSENITECDLRENLVLLGGAKNNRYTHRVISDFFEITGFKFTEKFNAIETPYGILRDEHKNNIISKDYAVIMRVPNDYSGRATSITILAGLHTYGVEAAASFYVNNMNGIKSIYRKNFITILELEIANFTSVRPKIIFQRKLKI